MEQTVNISFKFFDQALVQRVIEFTELSGDKKTKEAIKALSQEIKAIYLEKDAAMKQHIQQQLPVLKQAHQNNIAQLEQDLAQGLAEANGQAHDPKELQNIKFGLETACKRAKTKEKNRYNEEIKNLKFQRVFLHEEYTKLIYNVTGVVTPVESLRNKAIETKAAFNLKATLTNKQFYVNLVPLCMLLLIVAAYFIGKSITG